MGDLLYIACQGASAASQLLRMYVDAPACQAQFFPRGDQGRCLDLALFELK